MSNITVKIARSLDEILHVFTIRTLVYIGEQACPYHEEYDGNDFTGASHIIAYVNGEPAGVLRLRWFAKFVKLERAAVLKKFRGSGVIQKLMKFSFRYVEERGYQKILIHAQKQLVLFWERFDFTERRGRSSFCFSDYDYAEMEKDINAGNSAINIDADPMVLNRPDGEWGEAGVLDRSIIRGKPQNKHRKFSEAA